MHNKFTPYVRRANGKEMAGDMHTAVRLAYYRLRKETTGKPFYVLVQHGFRSLAIGVDKSKRDLEQSPMVVGFGRQRFPAWARALGKRARGPRWK